MQSIIKYRITGLMLATVFALFNIGLPIVVASCPMMKYADSNQCMMCDDGSQSGTAKFTNSIDKSCCETTYASDRNKTEFLQVGKLVDLSKLLLDVQFISSNITFGLQSAVSFSQFRDSSPPLSRDIPIFISSLLI